MEDRNGESSLGRGPSESGEPETPHRPLTRANGFFRSPEPPAAVAHPLEESEEDLWLNDQEERSRDNVPNYRRQIQQQEQQKRHSSASASGTRYNAYQTVPFPNISGSPGVHGGTPNGAGTDSSGGPVSPPRRLSLSRRQNSLNNSTTHADSSRDVAGHHGPPPAASSTSSPTRRSTRESPTRHADRRPRSRHHDITSSVVDATREPSRHHQQRRDRSTNTTEAYTSPPSRSHSTGSRAESVERFTAHLRAAVQAGESPAGDGAPRLPQRPRSLEHTTDSLEDGPAAAAVPRGHHARDFDDEEDVNVYPPQQQQRPRQQRRRTGDMYGHEAAVRPARGAAEQRGDDDSDRDELGPAMAAYRIANPIQRANALQGGAAPAAAAAAVPAEADGAAPPDVVNGGAAAAVRGARIATAEERRVRFLYHNRPRLRLTSAPKVLTCIVQDRDTWEQPLCYAPLLLPCMRNAFYAIPVQQVLRKSLQAETLNPLSPSVIYSLSLANEATGQPQLQPQPQQSSVLQPLSSVESQALLLLQTQHTTPLYHVPLTLPRPGTTANVGAAPQQSPSFFQRFLNAQPSYIAESGVGNRGAQTDTLGSSLSQNCLHLLYRAFCVRCAIASQAQAFQADARMRGAEPFKFGCCDFVGVESKSYAALLRWIVLLDCLTLGVPCGCCCYHGMGTALFGWHLRFVLRARYRIFSWTSIDLLIMCCVPGLAVDQQGAELLLNGMPEIPVGLAFMS